MSRRRVIGKAAAEQVRALSGPKSVFRRKVRTRPSNPLTRSGHVAVERHLKRLHVSRADFFEGLLHLFGDKLTREALDMVAQRINAAEDLAASLETA